jgi:hypothetical protein
MQMEDLFTNVPQGHILVLEGIKLSDIVPITCRRRPVTCYRMPPPNKFIRPDMHPSMTPLLCWWCGLQCRSYSKFIPHCIRREQFHPTILAKLKAHFDAHGVISEQIYNENFTYEYRNSTDLVSLEVCDPKGVFCEWSCAVAFAATLPESERWDALEGIRIFEAQFTGVRRNVIHPSPIRHVMSTYCGDCGISENAYRAILDDLK